MKLKIQETIDCDVLVIGGGGAGLRAAVEAKMNRADVLLVTKSRLGRPSNTWISKSIIAASGWGAANDNKGIHVEDTVKGGRFLNDRDRVAVIADRIVPEIAFLKESGVHFEMQDGEPRLLKIPGHRYARHVHGQNWTGGDLLSPLLKLAENKGVRFKEHVFITRLLAFDGQIKGALGFTLDGDFYAIRSKSIVLATGGYAQIFLNTNNAAGITGDGLALAYELGVAQRDMEFVQFFPTAMGRRGNRILVYERLLAQEGVFLRNRQGQDIIQKNGFSEATKLTRDDLAQLIMKEIKADPEGKQQIIIDLELLTEKAANELGQLLPPAWWEGQYYFEVAPTAHFCMGGIATDQSGQTSQKGLFAVGEATGGVHGANRLGGNALAEIFSMGSLVGSKASEYTKTIRPNSFAKGDIDREIDRLEGLFTDKGLPPQELIHELKTFMWDKAGIIRSKSQLEEALKRLLESWPEAKIKSPKDLRRLLEFDNMRLISEMVCLAGLERTETRGSHYRIDCPEEDNTNWLKNIYLRKTGSGMELETRDACFYNSLK